MKEVTMEVPVALQHLINANNKLLKEYQSLLLRQIDDANIQMMQILRLDPSNGWRLDLERMVYVRTEEETEQDNSVTD